MVNKVFKVTIIFLIIFSGILYYALIAKNSELSFDGAIYSQGPISLLKYGVYANYLYNQEEIDQLRFPIYPQGMISQYLINIPLSKLLGISHFSLQINNLIFLFLSAILLYYFTFRISGSFFLSVLSMLLFFTFPGLKYSGLSALGEVPAFFYILLSSFLLLKSSENPKYFPLLGISFYFTFHTKIFLILLAPVILFVLLFSWRFEKMITLRSLLIFLVFFIAPIFLLHLLYLNSYGWHELAGYYRKFNTLLIGNQYGSSSPSDITILDNFNTAVQALDQGYGSFYLYYIPLIFAYGISCYLLGRDLKNLLKLKGYQSELGQFYPVLLFLLAVSLLCMVWYHFGTMTHRYRRIFPILLLNELLYLAAFGLCYKLWIRNHKRVLVLMGTFIFLPLLFMHSVNFFKSFEIKVHEDGAIKDRREMVEVIKKIPTGEKIFGIGWWQSPKLSLFSSITFLDIQNNAKYDTGYVIVDRESLGAAPDLIKSVLTKYSHRLIKVNPHYQLYRWAFPYPIRNGFISSENISIQSAQITSNNLLNSHLALDNDLYSYWETSRPLKTGDYFIWDFKRQIRGNYIVLLPEDSFYNFTFPKCFDLFISIDGFNYKKVSSIDLFRYRGFNYQTPPKLSHEGILEIEISDEKYRFLKFVITRDSHYKWLLNEILIFNKQNQKSEQIDKDVSVTIANYLMKHNLKQVLTYDPLMTQLFIESQGEIPKDRRIGSRFTEGDLRPIKKFHLNTAPVIIVREDSFKKLTKKLKENNIEYHYDVICNYYIVKLFKRKWNERKDIIPHLEIKPKQNAKNIQFVEPNLFLNFGKKVSVDFLQLKFSHYQNPLNNQIRIEVSKDKKEWISIPAKWIPEEFYFFNGELIPVLKDPVLDIRSYKHEFAFMRFFLNPSDSSSTWSLSDIKLFNASSE